MAERFTTRAIPATSPSTASAPAPASSASARRARPTSPTPAAPIKEAEIETCKANGRDPIEFRVGTDALAVVVSQGEQLPHGLTLEQLAAIFTGDVKTWADVDPSWPAEEIQLFSPGTDSGTFDYFVEAVLGKDDTKLQASATAQFSEDDNVLVQGVEGSPYAIGYFGYAYYTRRRQAEGAGDRRRDADEPTTVDNGDYPLARPLFIYSDAKIMKRSRRWPSFINFYLTQRRTTRSSRSATSRPASRR